MWLFNTAFIAALPTLESGDILPRCIWTELGINTLYNFGGTSHYDREAQMSGMVLFAQHDIPTANPTSSTWTFESIVIDEIPPQPE
jgi:hypothetical protein